MSRSPELLRAGRNSGMPCCLRCICFWVETNTQVGLDATALRATAALDTITRARVQTWLKKKGLASAGKKAGRAATEGLVESYIHSNSALGILIEVNCETDFVAKGAQFKELAEDMAMQVHIHCTKQLLLLR